MKTVLTAWHRLRHALARIPHRPTRGRRTAPGHPGMAALRWAGVIAPWAALCSALVVPIALVAWTLR